MQASEVVIGRLGLDHVADFLVLARKEGWFCERWEFDFVLKTFPQGCWVAVSNGVAAGFVTAVKYEKSGWVGNLLVRDDLRGRGLGKALMAQALIALDHAGAKTIWLTASPAGQRLYKKLGFIPVDGITRWRGNIGGGQALKKPPLSLASIEETDLMGWGDLRRELLRRTVQRGIVVSRAEGFCILQVTDHGLQVGPWGCRRRGIAEGLLQEARAAAAPHPAGIFLDVPDGNREAAALMRRHGFSRCGDTVLMYRGSRPAYRPEHIYALATMGSMG